MITERQLYMMAGNPRDIADANQYIQHQLISNLKLSKTEYSATVDGEKASVQFQDQKIIGFRCSCHQARFPNGACKHVITVLKKAQQLIDLSRQESMRMEQITNDIFDSFTQDTYQEYIIKQPLVLQKNLEICNTSKYKARLSFKLGISKLYVVKDILEMIEAFRYDREIEFSDLFTLNPYFQQLNDMDQRLLELINDIYYTSPHCLYNRYLLLDDFYLKKVLDAMMGQKINLKINDISYENIEIIQEKLENPVKVNYDGKSIGLDLSSYKKMTAITEGYEYIVYSNYIYHLPQKEIYQLKPFLQAASKDIFCIRFTNRKKDEFIAKIIPCLPGSIELPDLLKEEILQFPLKAKLYLDKSTTMITAKPVFQYGFYEFNPLENPSSIMIDGKYLIRQLKKEERLMNILDNANFKVHASQLYIDKQEDVLDFVNIYLSLIQENMEVFYSDSFKTIIKHKTLNYQMHFNESTQLFDISFSYDHILKSDFKNMIRGYHLKQKYYRLSDGSFISLDDENTKNLMESLDYVNLDVNDITKSKVSINLSQALILNQHLDLEKTDVRFKELVNNISAKQPLEFDKLPKQLHATFRDYQVIGYQWLKTLNYYQFGGILADDMGLGKTVQALAFILDESRRSILPNLVVCPTSLVYNWEDEIKKFTPTLKYLIVTGNQAARKELISTIKDYQLVITSYPLMRNDYPLYLEYQFNHFILDEAQNIKNPNSLNARSVKQIKAHTRYALTGTPIENSLSELWSIFDFIMPGMLLSRYKFRENYEKPIILDHNKNIEELLYKRIQPFILRRMKSEVLTELPEKIETKYSIELTDKQKALYLDLLSQTRTDLQEEFNRNGYEKSQMKVLAAITRLRQLCNHPALFIENYTGGSGKLTAIMEIIEEAMISKRKVLIFSQFVSMLQIIKEQLDLEEIPHYYLDGNTPTMQRLQLVKDFNENDVPIFLISLKAGGTGLNLTSASIVVHIDPWWNPAVEQQATDRAYRIGQEQNVQVIKLITKGTIEEKIYELQEQKKNLIDSIIKPGETFINKLSEEELMKLLI